MQYIYLFKQFRLSQPLRSWLTDDRLPQKRKVEWKILVGCVIRQMNITKMGHIQKLLGKIKEYNQ